MELIDIFWFVIFVIVVLLIGLDGGKLISIKDEGIKYFVHESRIDPQFADKTYDILRESEWNNYHGYSRTYNVNEADINIFLKSDEWMEPYHRVKKFYPSGKQIRWSITEQNRGKKPLVYINAKSWIRGVPESGLSLAQYREYVINHEFGHALGYHHQTCSVDSAGATCPVMYQSTRGCPPGKDCGYAPDARDLGTRIPNAYLRISPLDE